MARYSCFGVPGDYRLRREHRGMTYYINVPAKFNDRIEFIKLRFGDNYIKLQSKLQTLYLFLRASGCEERDFDQIDLFDIQAIV